MWIILSLVSAFFFGMRQVIEKQVLRKERTFEMLLVESFIIFVLVCSLPLFTNISVSLMTILIIAINSLIAVIGNMLLNKAIKNSEVSSITPLLNTTPIFLIFVAFIFLGEVPNLIQLLGVFIIVFGAYLLNLKSFFHFFTFHKSAKKKYIFYALLTALLFSILATVARNYTQKIPVLTYLFYFEVFFFTHTLIYALFDKRIISSYNTLKRSWKLISFSSIFIMISEIFILTAMSMPLALVALVVPIRRTSTFFSAFIGGKFFKEQNLTHKIISCMIMLMGIFVIALG